MRLVYISLEFVCPFSGNGTLSQSSVRALTQLGNEVCVVCACPRSASGGGDGTSLLAEVIEGWTKAGWKGSAVSGAVVPVDVWTVHGRNSAWDGFGDGIACPEASDVIETFLSHGVDAVLGVDWEANKAYKALRQRFASLAAAPYIYYNYRVYFCNTSNTDEDTAFFLDHERAALELSDQQCYICLCKSDKLKLENAFVVSPHVLLPALREELRLRAISVKGSQDRRYLLSCVRVVPEKNVEAFVACIEALGAAWLEANGVVPLMIGAVAQPEFGARVHGRLRAACPAAEVHEFLPGDAMADLMSASLLNFHPALNEAYGMTIVEAAALGCPSIVHLQEIGAADFLSQERGELLFADMAQPTAVAEDVRKLLGTADGRQQLSKVGELARERALSYDEVENARRLLDILREPGPPRAE